MLYLQIASPKSSVLNFLDSNSFEVIISIFQRTEKVPDMERLLIENEKLVLEWAEEYSTLQNTDCELWSFFIERIKNLTNAK